MDLHVPHPEPLWVSRQAVDLIHEEQRQAHGGAFGVRDSGAIDSALGRAQARFVYGGGDLAEIAAAYAYGLAKNHGYVDANKRTAWVVCRTFLGPAPRGGAEESVRLGWWAGLPVTGPG